MLLIDEVCIEIDTIVESFNADFFLSGYLGRCLFGETRFSRARTKWIGFNLFEG